MSFTTYDPTRLGTARTGVSDISELSSITLINSTDQLQKPRAFQELQIEEEPKPTRSKFRLFAILFALYVGSRALPSRFVRGRVSAN